MKKAFIYTSAVVALAISMLLGAVFGVNECAEKVAEGTAAPPIATDRAAVVKH